MSSNYMDILGICFPDVEAYCQGDPTVYENIIYERGSPLPSQDEMDLCGLTNAQNIQVSQLSDSCRQEIIAGFMSSALGSQYFYASKLEDQVNLITSITCTAPGVLNAEAVSQDYPVREVVLDVVKPKEWITHTYLQLLQVLRDFNTHREAALATFAQKKKCVLLATSIDQVELVTWTSTP